MVEKIARIAPSSTIESISEKFFERTKQMKSFRKKLFVVAAVVVGRFRRLFVVVIAAVVDDRFRRDKNRLLSLAKLLLVQMHMALSVALSQEGSLRQRKHRY